MNFELAREIYGIGVWSVDSNTLPAMLQILSSSKNGLKLELPEKKYNSISFLNFKSEDDYEECDSCEQENQEVQGIAIVNLDGAITVGGGMSSCGMTELSESMLKLSKEESIRGFLIYANSGGGSTMAVEIMTDAISEIRKTKPVFGLVKKGGMAASAAYAILSACEEIYAESEMSIVGSCGTMIQFEGRAANTEDGEGEKYIRLYASKSTDKNKAIEEALNKDNYSVIVDEMLNPINERFLQLIESNRPILKGTDFDNGHDSFAKDSIGKFIDGISTKSKVVSMLLSKTSVYQNLNINQNSNKMNKTELKQSFPDVYSEIISEGVGKEKERVASWLQYSSADPKAVQEGIASGLEITASQSHGFLVALANKGRIADLKSDNAPALVTDQTQTNESEDSKTEKQKEIESAFNFKL